MTSLVHTNTVISVSWFRIRVLYFTLSTKGRKRGSIVCRGKVSSCNIFEAAEDTFKCTPIDAQWRNEIARMGLQEVLTQSVEAPVHNLQ